MTIEDFISDNIELIDDNKWDEVYLAALYIANKVKWSAGQLTDMLLAVGIDPLTSNSTTNNIPPLYLQRSVLEELIIPENISTIGYGAFLGANLRKIVIPTSVIRISQNAFMALPISCQIIYKGTIAEFDRIKIDYPGQFGGKVVNCSDGIWEKY